MKVITLCGSMRFAEQMRQIALRLETKEGHCVICPLFDCGETLSEVDLKKFSQAHFKKIDIADIVYVVDIDGYIGESVSGEIRYAKQCGKQIIYHSKTI